MERLPGFRDFYPDPVPHENAWSARVRQYVFDTWRRMARCYGFVEYDGPPLEPLELYTLKSGPEIVRQLFDFVDKGGRHVALRPELTPTLARMVAAHHRNYKKPLKWFAIPQLFRYEKQQRGRLREHFQFNADIIGEPDVGAEAELIALIIDTLRAFGLTESDFVVKISSRAVWDEFFNRVCKKAELREEFYLAVDKLDRDRANSEETLRSMGIPPETVYALTEKAEPTGDLIRLLENLRARGMQEFVTVDYKIIRGLAYYTGIVFEVFDRKGQFRAIAGGGRYDRLVKLISGGKVDLPAAGFGMGDVVLTELLTERGLIPTFEPTVLVYVIIQHESVREYGLSIVQRLREKGYSVDYPLSQTKLDKQIKVTRDLNAQVVVEVALDSQSGLPYARVRLANLPTAEQRVANDPSSVCQIVGDFLKEQVHSIRD